MKKFFVVLMFVVGCVAPTPPGVLQGNAHGFIAWGDASPMIGIPGVDRVMVTKKEGFVIVTVETNKPSDGLVVSSTNDDGKQHEGIYRGGFVWSVRVPIEALRESAVDEGVVLLISTVSPVTGYPGTSKYIFDLVSGRIGRFDECLIAQQVADLRAITPPYTPRTRDS